MTLAICIKCGNQKHGALTPCLECGFDPSSPQDQTKSVALSDHNLTPEELAAVGQRIQAGEPLDFDEASINEMAEFIRMCLPVNCPTRLSKLLEASLELLRGLWERIMPRVMQGMKKHQSDPAGQKAPRILSGKAA